MEHSEVGASFGCRVARSRKGRGVRDSGSAHTVFGVVKEMLSGSVVRCGGWEREPAPALTSDSEEGLGKGRQREWSTAPNLAVNGGGNW